MKNFNYSKKSIDENHSIAELNFNIIKTITFNNSCFEVGLQSLIIDILVKSDVCQANVFSSQSFITIYVNAVQIYDL